MFHSDPKDYEIKAELASCCHGIGTVYLAKHKNSREFVALKRFKMDKAKEESNAIRVSLPSTLYCLRLKTSIGCDAGINLLFHFGLFFAFSGRNINNATIEFSSYLTITHGFC